MCATHDEMVSVLTVNKRREPSPDLLRHSNAELCAVTSSSLISLLQHGGVGNGADLVMTALKTSVELS